VAIDPALHKSDRAWAQALIDSSEQSPRTVEAVAAANPRWDIRDAEDRAAAFQSADWDQMRQIMLDVPDWDVRGRLGALAGRIPTLLVLADPSYLVPPDDAKQIENALGPGSVVVRPNTTHSVHRDDFDGFLQAMLDWIGPS
jgi:pimeloyl-ACP methyl ester carboxylesterase